MDRIDLSLLCLYSAPCFALTLLLFCSHSALYYSLTLLPILLSLYSLLFSHSAPCFALTLLPTQLFCPHLSLSDLRFQMMHSIGLCVFLWTIGGLGKISNSCSFVDVGKLSALGGFPLNQTR
jgi:hypothetical protein